MFLFNVICMLFNEDVNVLYFVNELVFLFFGIYKNITEIKSKNNKMKNTKMKIK